MSEQKQKEEDGGDTEPGRKHFYFLISGGGGFGQVAQLGQEHKVSGLIPTRQTIFHLNLSFY